jgi:hypothetical protein
VTGSLNSTGGPLPDLTTVSSSLQIFDRYITPPEHLELPKCPARHLRVCHATLDVASLTQISIYNSTYVKIVYFIVLRENLDTCYSMEITGRGRNP